MSHPLPAITADTHLVTAHLQPGDTVYLLRLEYRFSGDLQAVICSSVLLTE